jgi:hypothetical protein
MGAEAPRAHAAADIVRTRRETRDPGARMPRSFAPRSWFAKSTRADAGVREVTEITSLIFLE